MDEEKNKELEKIEFKNIFIKDENYFSKAIKQIDSELKFNRTIKRIKIIKNYDKIISNEILSENNRPKLKNKKYIINSKKNNSKSIEYSDGDILLKKISLKKRLAYLPKISPYIYNNNTSISFDYNKASEMGAFGFHSLYNNEGEIIKDILYDYNDDYNNNIIKDYNSCAYLNKVNDKLKTENKHGNTNSNNENEKNNLEIKDYGKEVKNIFDENYSEKKKISIFNKLLLRKIERIKIQNKKVNKIFKEYKNKFYNKNVDNRIYKINYNSIEKHIPYTIINTKSKRIFPEYYINKNNNIISKNLKKKENKLFTERLNKIKLKKNLSNPIIYSFNN